MRIPGKSVPVKIPAPEPVVIPDTPGLPEPDYEPERAPEEQPTEPEKVPA